MTAEHRMALVAVLAAVIGFAAGALWQYVDARGTARALSETRHELAFQRLDATLGAATVEAQRGSYETARQLASSFFTGLQAVVASAAADQRQELQGILAQRDPAITALSRSDPQSGSMLAQLFQRYRSVMRLPVEANADVPAAAGDTGR